MADEDDKKGKKGQSAAAAALTAAMKVDGGSTEPEQAAEPELKAGEPAKLDLTGMPELPPLPANPEFVQGITPAPEKIIEKMPEEMDKPVAPVEAVPEPVVAIPRKDYIVLETNRFQLGFNQVKIKSGEILSDHVQIQELLKAGAAIIPVDGAELTVCPKCTFRWLPEAAK